MPIIADFFISFSAAVIGLVVLITKMRVIDKNTYTPLLEVMAVCAGSLGWSIFALMSFTSFTSIPYWLSGGEVWKGHWGYTAARLCFAIAWGLILVLITKYSYYMQSRIKRKSDIKKRGGYE